MDSKKLNIFMNVLKYVLGAAGVIACIFLFFGPNGEDTTQAQEAFRDGAAMNTAIYFSIAIILISLVLVLAFFAVQLVSNPKRTFMSIVGVVVAAVLFFIFWGIGSSDNAESIGVAREYNSSISWISAGIYVTFFGIVIGLLAAVMGLFMRFRK